LENFNVLLIQVHTLSYSVSIDQMGCSILAVDFSAFVDRFVSSAACFELWAAVAISR
jgi:hypothetical protein